MVQHFTLQLWNETLSRMSEYLREYEMLLTAPDVLAVCNPGDDSSIRITIALQINL